MEKKMRVAEISKSDWKLYRERIKKDKKHPERRTYVRQKRAVLCFLL